MGALLIVDDEPEYLAELVEALGYHDIRSVAAANGAQALLALRKDPTISLVLTDIRMPDMDGIALVEAARNAFPGRILRFVMMTGHAAPLDLERARAAGVEGCFPKPLVFEDLCAALIALHKFSP